MQSAGCRCRLPLCRSTPVSAHFITCSVCAAVPVVQQALAMADPSEPKYCNCQRISFGEMIACENPGAHWWGWVGGWRAGGREGGGHPARGPLLQLLLTRCPRRCPRPRSPLGRAPPLATADCPYEWFHFGCVGLTEETRPKGACGPSPPAFLLHLPPLVPRRCACVAF